MGKAGGQGQGPQAAGWSQVKEQLEAGLVYNMTEAFLPERDVDVVKALPIRAGGFCGEAGNSGGEGSGGLPRI